MSTFDPTDDPMPGAEVGVPEFVEPEPGPFEQFHQPLPPSPILRRIGAGPFRFAIGAVFVVAIVILLAETF